MTTNGLCKCGGIGTTEDPDGRLRECWCAYIRRRAADMPLYVRNAEVLRQHLHLPAVRAAGHSILIEGAWLDVKAVIKVTMLRNPSLFVKITSDREILDVFLGKASKASRGDDSAIYYNSIQDLMDPPGLSVVRLNEISYKNKAASGALEEALNYRLERDKPTWVVSLAERPFQFGSPAWSESVQDVIRSSLRRSKIEPILSAGSGPPPLELESVHRQVKSLDNSAPVAYAAASMGPPTVVMERISESGPKREPKDLPQEPRREKKIRSIPDEEGVVGNYGVGLDRKKPFRGRI